MEYSYLNEALILLASTVAVLLLLLRLGLPSVLGYFLVGISIGPFGMGLISNVDHIRVLAEFGVVFLLFSIGLEFSLPLLVRMKSAVFGLGGAQVAATVMIVASGAALLGMEAEAAIVLGGIVAMSSTALVTKQLADQAELHTRHGRNSIGILLFQDLMVVPLLILVAMLNGESGEMNLATLSLVFAEGVAALALIFICGRWVLRPLFRSIAAFHSAELFTMAVLLIVLCSAWVTHTIGLTFALGAFLAGVMLSETEFRHQMESEIRPFRDILLGLFFISIGMMLDISVIPEIWLAIALLLLVLVMFKMALVGLFCKLAGWNGSVSARTGLVLAHGGEFGLAVLLLCMDGNILQYAEGQMLLAAMLFSMAMAPLMIRHNGDIVAWLFPSMMVRSKKEISERARRDADALDGHVIVCGYGRVGEHALGLLKEHQVPALAIDLDVERVKQGKSEGKLVTYGDAGSIELLHACGLSRASLLIVSMIDFQTAIKIISRVRGENSTVQIIVRTRKELDLFRFYQAGANDVVADVFGSNEMIKKEALARFGLIELEKMG